MASRIDICSVAGEIYKGSGGWKTIGAGFKGFFCIQLENWGNDPIGLFFFWSWVGSSNYRNHVLFVDAVIYMISAFDMLHVMLTCVGISWIRGNQEPQIYPYVINIHRRQARIYYVVVFLQYTIHGSSGQWFGISLNVLRFFLTKRLHVNNNMLTTLGSESNMFKALHNQ